MKGTLTLSTLRLCLIVCLSHFSLLFTLAGLTVAQTNQASKTTERNAARSQNAELESLYQTHQWFKLRDAVQTTRASAFYRGVVDSAFNNIKQAENNLKAAIKAAPQSEQASEARSLLIYVYMRAGRYRQALSEVERGLAAKPDDANLKNARALFGALTQYPAQSVVERRFSRIRYSMKGGNLFIPAEINAKSTSCMLDTGANFSLISEGEAKRLGLTIHDSGGSKLGDSSGVNFDTRIAVADSLTVGNIRLRHVTFFVVGDNQQPFVDLPLGERAILGLPVILAFQTLRWKQDGTFEIGFAPRYINARKSNLCFEGAHAIIEGEFRQNKINIFLDTGAIRTRVLPLFAKEFASFVNESGRKDSERVTGVGGSVEVDSLKLPELRLRVSGFDTVLRPAQVLLKETTSDSRWWHVWAGMDLLNQVRVVTLDFKSMTLVLE